MKYKFPLYILFCIVCIVFSLYRHFPGRAAADYIEKRVFSTDKGLSVKVAPLFPNFPLGVRSASITPTWKGHPFPRLDQFKARLNLTSIFRDNWQVSYSGRLCGGDLFGTATLADKGDVKTLSQILGVKLEDINLGPNLFNARFSGLINASVSTGSTRGRPEECRGEIRSDNLGLQFPGPLFGIKGISFSRAVLAFEMPSPDTIQIKSCKITGNRMDIQLSGEIRPAQSFGGSGLDLRAQLTLHPRFFMDTADNGPVDLPRRSDPGVIDLKITGTIEDISMETIQGEG